MSNLIRIYNDEPRAGTKFIADGFAREHKRITFFINKYREEFETLGQIPARKISTKGKSTTEFMLNEEQTIFLGTLLKNTQLVVAFKLNLVKEFSKVKKQLEYLRQQQNTPRYQITRDAGKIVRKETTDGIKRFVTYAEANGSKNADKYYLSISAMLNRLLFTVEGKYKNLRNVMTTQQLMTVSSAEQIINKGLQEGMEEGKPYKLIYQDIKKKVSVFAKLHGKSEVISGTRQLEAAQ